MRHFQAFKLQRSYEELAGRQARELESCAGCLMTSCFVEEVPRQPQVISESNGGVQQSLIRQESQLMFGQVDTLVTMIALLQLDSLSLVCRSDAAVEPESHLRLGRI